MSINQSSTDVVGQSQAFNYNGGGGVASAPFEFTFHTDERIEECWITCEVAAYGYQVGETMIRAKYKPKTLGDFGRAQICDELMRLATGVNPT